MSVRTKVLLKYCCKFVYYAGCGNYWYEDINHETIPFKLYCFISFSIYTTMIFLENLAAVFGSFPAVEKNSSVMFAAIHNIVLTKMYLFLYHKESIRKLNYEMATVGENLEEENIMKKQYRKVKYGILFYVISVYLSLGAYGVESTRRSLVDGAPFYTVVTYLPKYEDPTMIAAVFRMFFYITWLYMMLPMMSADCMPITHLICIAFKFVTLRRHFERIREDFDIDIETMNKEDAEEKLRAGCLEGILMHQKLMYLADEINRVFGIIMSLQVCESSAVAVLLLLRLALSPHLDLTNAFMTYTFVGSLFFLLALNLWNAGEITHQASLLSPAVFYCGWHMCRARRRRRDIRRLVLIACAQAQKPLILKAFGIQDLSYGTFVSVSAPFYTVVTYLPKYEDPTMMAAVFRVFFYITWLYMMLPMMSADCMPITHLICIAFKFVTLRRHFERIREDFDIDIETMNKEDAEEKLRSGCLEGILMHQKLMYLADEINRVFGIIMSLQVCESSAVAVLLLLRLALSPHLDLTNAFMTYTFVGSLFFLLALNLWNAGEITHQASLLSPAVFYCGWHMCRARRRRRDIRRLVLIACAQAQKPLILKAFGIQDLSYGTFVSVARMTYSVFAVFYQRGG